MWICPLCQQQFVKTSQPHSCGDKMLADFLVGKTETALQLFWHFVGQYKKLGEVTIHATKSMIAFAADTRIAYVIKLGKNFVDIVFPFTQPYYDNLCFHKIAQVPGTNQYNHHLRMLQVDDINEEVIDFMKLAYDNGLKTDG